MPLLLAVLTVALRLIYLFVFSGYEDNLYSDMAGYWQRAHDHLLSGTRSATPMETDQWMLQAPLFHVIASSVLRGARESPALWDHRLEIYLVLQALLGGMSSFFFYFLTHNIFASRRLAAIMTGIFALTFPLIYLGGFVMTENIAVPLLIASVFYATRRHRTSMVASAALVGLLSSVFLFPMYFTVIAIVLACVLHWLAGEDDSIVTSAICLAIAIAIRPANLLFAGPLVLFVLVRHSPTPKWRAGTLYVLSFLLVAGIASHYNSVVSSGRIVGLGASGGIAFYMAQCEYDRVFFGYQGRRYWMIQPGSEGKETLRTNDDETPPFEQSHYYRAGLDCLKDNPTPLAFNLKRLKGLYIGTFFPAVNRPPWEFRALSVFYVPVFISFSLVLLLAAPLVFIRGNLFEDRHYYLMWTLFVVLLVTHMFFNVEQRYLLPGLFAVYLGAGSALLRCFPRLRNVLGVP
jgi:hypothetical protein